MKRICIALAAVAMLFATSCKNNNEPENVVLGENEFYATIANDANPQNAPAAGDEMSTKTTIDPNRYVIWDSDDTIYINGTEFTHSLGTNKENVFTPTHGNAGTAPYYGFYAVTGASNSASATLPATQIYKSGKVSNLPMYAYSASAQELTFHNICAALKFNIPSSANGASKIEISTTDTKALNGAFTVNSTTFAAEMNVSSIADDNKKITIQKASGTFATNEIVYVAIPAATYANLTFKFYNGTTEITDLTRTLSQSTTFAVNKVYNINFFTSKIFYIQALQAGSTVRFDKLGNTGVSGFTGLQYSTDGTNWSNLTFGNGSSTTSTAEATGDQTITLTNVGDKVYFKAISSNTSLAYDENSNLYRFTLTGIVKAGGNVMYLLNQNGTNTFPSGSRYAFSSIFRYQTALTDISEISLPATTLARDCYHDLFLGTGIQSLPENLLPSTATLAPSCCVAMFYDCTGLTSIPENLLPTTSLAGGCYHLMFAGCTNLTSIPEKLLPATTLAQECYKYMFQGCTGLTSIPEKLLPATTLAQECYKYMFQGCTSLTSAPELPATTLETGCYQYMFYGCTSLTSAPELPATTLATRCYLNMFYGCTNLGSVTMKATDVSASDCLYQWLYNAGTSATNPTLKVANQSMSTNTTITNNLPSGWLITY